MFNKYPKGSDLTIMQTIYHYPSKNVETGKWSKGAITIVAKDNISGEKIQETLTNPGYTYYVLKEGVQIKSGIDYNLEYIEKDKTDEIFVPYNQLDKSVAEQTDNLQLYFNNLKSGNRRENSKLHMNPKILFSDMNIEDYYRFLFSKKYTNQVCKINKSFFDIEVDIKNMAGDFPDPGECPVNAITLMDIHTKTVYTLLLRNEKNKLIEEFEKSMDKKLFGELRDLIRYTVGGEKNEIKYGLDKFKFNMEFFDEEDEISLIAQLFNLINTIQPDFVLVWNMAFDVPYLIQRITNLGYEPKDIMCHPDFTNKVAKYMIDERAQVLAERGDSATISSYSVYLDQMIQFASRRKGQSAFISFKLDSIGSKIAGVKKLDYSDITHDISQLPYLDFKRFVFYNIVDVIVQYCIEFNTEDISYTFNKCVSNNTRYSKAHRQTVYLINRLASEYYDMGYIIGNNTNKGNSKPNEKFPGAFVADPLKISDLVKLKLNGYPVMLFNNLDDFDFARLYPSILQEFNMSATTQIGKLIISEQIHNFENRSGDTKYSRDGAFLEDIASKNYLEFGQRWLKLAGYEELCKDVYEYYSTIEDPCCGPIFTINADGTQDLLVRIPTDHVSKFMYRIPEDELTTVIYRSIPINKKMVGDLNDIYNQRAGLTINRNI